MTLLYGLGIIAAIWVLVYFRSPAFVWALAVIAAISTWISVDDSSLVAQAVVAFIAIVVIVVMMIRPLRRQLISNRLFLIFRQSSPVMSASEQEALEAGNVWWDAELFSGRPDWKKWLSHSSPALSDEERQFIDGPVDELCAMIDDWKITDQQHDLPAEVWDYIKSNRFFAIIIPKEYGGLGFSAMAHSTIVMKIASRSVTAAVTVMVPNSLGPAELLLQYGTDQQRDYYLPRLAAGEDIPCFALTGPEAGSDASSIPDSGVVCRADYNGHKDVLGIRLNWEKRYITLGPVATLLGLAFRLYDPQHIIGDEDDIGITLALIPTDTDGIEIGHRHNPLGIAFMNGPNRGKDVFIPLDWVIGGQARIGQGWKMLMESLATGRSISLPALSTGAGKLACRATGAYTRIRRQFRQPIGKFEGIEEALTRIAAHTYQMDAVRQVTANAIDQGHSPSVLSAIAKYHLTEKMRIVINDAMDIQAGSAICLGPRNIIARIYQSIPISITVEGANILTRSMIIFGQGAIRCHPYIHKLMQTAHTSDQVRAARDFDRLLFRQIRFFVSNIARSLFAGLSKARLLRTPDNGDEAYYYRQLSRMSTAFTLLADTYVMTLGSELKRREKISARLADMLSELYIASCVLKHYRDQGSHPQDLPLVQWCCDHILNTLQQRIYGLLRNYPNKAVGWLLKKIIFPYGPSFTPPADKLGSSVAALLQEPNPSRSRLTQDIYIPHNTNDTLGRIESALTRVIVAEPVEATIRHAVKQGLLEAKPVDTLTQRAVDARIITPEQADIVHAADRARRDVIMVDEFSHDLKQHFDPVSAPIKKNNNPLTSMEEVHKHVS